MKTKTVTCRVRFVGGPSDGLVLSDPDFKIRTKLQMPAAPAFVQCGQHSCRELVGYWFTTYQLRGRQRVIEAGRLTTCLRYDFVGYEPLENQVERDSSRRRAPERWVGLRNWFSQLRRKVANWMLEPIDHPLRAPAEQP